MNGDALEDSEDGFIALVVPVTAYFDASLNKPKGTTANDPRVLTVATYIARRKDWSDLRGEWRKVLSDYNVPYFHMKEFEFDKGVATYQTGKISSESPYKDWQVSRYNDFFEDLSKVINSRSYGVPRITSATSSIMLDDYDSTLPDDLKVHPRCRSAFIFTVANVMEMIAAWANAFSYYEPIHYIFAGGDKEAGHLDPWFNRCFKRESTIKHFRLAKGFSRIGHDVAWMKREPALQMVDCPAYELNRAVVEWAKRDFNPTLKSDLRASLSILCKIDHFGLTLRAPELIESYRDIRLNDHSLGFIKPLYFSGEDGTG